MRCFQVGHGQRWSRDVQALDQWMSRAWECAAGAGGRRMMPGERSWRCGSGSGGQREGPDSPHGASDLCPSPHPGNAKVVMEVCPPRACVHENVSHEPEGSEIHHDAHCAPPGYSHQHHVYVWPSRHQSHWHSLAMRCYLQDWTKSNTECH